MSHNSTARSGPAYVLQAQDVAIHYGGVKALDGASLTLEKGQIRGLIGPNGAGKSTVIDAITGRRPLTRGQVTLMGEDVSALGAVERRRRGLSRSFQRTSIFPGLTVREQLELVASQLGEPDLDGIGGRRGRRRGQRAGRRDFSRPCPPSPASCSSPGPGRRCRRARARTAPPSSSRCGRTGPGP